MIRRGAHAATLALKPLVASAVDREPHGPPVSLGRVLRQSHRNTKEMPKWER